MAVLFIVGPSQAGKSSVAQAADEAGIATHVDLDVLLQQRYPSLPLIEVAQDWVVVSGILEELEASEPSAVPTLVTIGAGTQDLDRARQARRLEHWLLHRRDRVLLITDDRDILFARNAAHRDARARFDELEFGPSRVRIYETAAHTLDFTGLGKGDASLCFARCVADLVTAQRD